MIFLNIPVKKLVLLEFIFTRSHRTWLIVVALEKLWCWVGLHLESHKTWAVG